MFQSILSGLMDASDIIFFGMISYGYMVLLIHVGALNAGIYGFIPVVMGIFIICMFIVGFINGMGPGETCRTVAEIFKDILIVI